MATPVLTNTRKWLWIVWDLEKTRMRVGATETHLNPTEKRIKNCVYGHFAQTFARIFFFLLWIMQKDRRNEHAHLRSFLEKRAPRSHITDPHLSGYSPLSPKISATVWRGCVLRVFNSSLVVFGRVSKAHQSFTRARRGEAALAFCGPPCTRTDGWWVRWRAFRLDLPSTDALPHAQSLKIWADRAMTITCRRAHSSPQFSHKKRHSASLRRASLIYALMQSPKQIK